MAWPKGVPRKKTVKLLAYNPEITGKTQAELDATTTEPRASDPVFPHVATGADPHDKKLDYFQYDPEASSYEWEKENPLKVPRAILERYPGMRPRWRAIDPKTGGLRNGDLYQGWQVFKDSKYPNGLKSGGDLVLSFMPEERAVSRNLHYQDMSTEQVKGIQEKQVTAVDRANAELRAAGTDASVNAAITVGANRTRNKATGAVKEVFRGYHPDQIAEMQAKAREDRSKDRAYSIPGTKPSGRVQR